MPVEGLRLHFLHQQMLLGHVVGQRPGADVIHVALVQGGVMFVIGQCSSIVVLLFLELVEHFVVIHQPLAGVIGMADG